MAQAGIATAKAEFANLLAAKVGPGTPSKKPIAGAPSSSGIEFEMACRASGTGCGLLA